VLIILSTRLLGLFTSMAVGLELAIVVVLVLGLAPSWCSPAAATSATSPLAYHAADSNYFAIGGGLMAATIMA